MQAVKLQLEFILNQGITSYWLVYPLFLFIVYFRQYLGDIIGFIPPSITFPIFSIVFLFGGAAASPAPKAKTPMLLM